MEGGRRGEKRRPGALRGRTKTRTRTRKSAPPGKLQATSSSSSNKSAWKRRAGARNRGNSRNACMGKLGPDAEQPFSLSQPNREMLCHLSLGESGMGVTVRIPAHSSTATPYLLPAAVTQDWTGLGKGPRGPGTLLHICTLHSALLHLFSFPPFLASSPKPIVQSFFPLPGAPGGPSALACEADATPKSAKATVN